MSLVSRTRPIRSFLKPHLQAFWLQRGLSSGPPTLQNDGMVIEDELNCSRIGLVADSVLVVAKGAVAVTSGSSALLADAAHSAADMFSSAVVYLCVGKARDPPDEDHPYGHGKVESLGTLFMASALLATGAGMGWHSGHEFWTLSSFAAEAAAEVVPSSVDSAAPDGGMGVAALVAAGSVGAKEALYRYTLSVGKRNGNSLLVASAWHHRSDALSSVVALGGAGGATLLGLPLLDPLGGLVVSGMIIKVGIDAGLEVGSHSCHSITTYFHLFCQEPTISHCRCATRGPPRRAPSGPPHCAASLVYPPRLTPSGCGPGLRGAARRGAAVGRAPGLYRRRPGRARRQPRMAPLGGPRCVGQG